MSLSFTLTIGPVIKSSFNALLRLHEVIQINELVAIFADTWTEIHAVEEQAGFRYGTAGSMRLQDDGDGFRNENWHEQRAKRFEWVLGINYSLPSRSFFISTLRLIRDTGNVLCNRTNTEGY